MTTLHRTPRWRLYHPAAAGALVLMLTAGAASAFDQIRVRIPHRGPADAAIRALKLRLDLPTRSRGSGVVVTVVPTSGRPKSPITTATRLNPFISSGTPKAKRE